MGEKYYTAKEVAEILGICKETVRRRIRDGSLKKIELARNAYRIAESDLCEYLSHCKQNGKEE